MRTSLIWMQLHLLYGVRIGPHGVILRHILNTVNSFLCSSVNDLENRLPPNDLIVIRNQGVDQVGHLKHQDGAGEPRKHAHQGGSSIQFRI
jgi:hypothetical protein